MLVKRTYFKGVVQRGGKERALQVNVDAPDLATAVELENRNQLIAADSEEAAAARQRWAER